MGFASGLELPRESLTLKPVLWAHCKLSCLKIERNYVNDSGDFITYVTLMAAELISWSLLLNYFKYHVYEVGWGGIYL